MYNLVFKNTVFLAIAEAINKASSFLITVLLARYLGSEDFGRLSFVLSVVGLLYIVADFGLSTLAVRELAQNKERTRHFVEQLISIKLLLGGLLIVGAGVVVAALKDDTLIRQISFTLALSMALNSLVQIAFTVFRAYERMKLESVVKLISAGVMLAILGYLIFAERSLAEIGWGYAAVSGLTLLVAIFTTGRNFTSFAPKFHPQTVKTILSMSWPFALGTILASIYRYIDSIMLGSFVSIQEVGWYNAAYRLVDAVALGAALFGTALYPTLSRLAKETAGDRFEQLTRGALRVISWSIAPIAGIIFVLSRQIVSFLYGAEYLPGAFSLSILIWTAVISYLNMVAVKALQAKHLVMLPVWAAASGAIVNVALNLWLIPIYGITGAAVSTAVAYGLTFLVLWISTLRVTGLNLVQYMVKPVLALLPALYVGSLPTLRADGVFPGVFIAGGIYLVLIWLLKGITVRDLVRLKEIAFNKDV